MTDYVINVLEEKRPEFSGFAVCPFVKADRLADQLHLDVFDNTKDTLVEVIRRFVRSGKRSALVGQPNVSVGAAETKGYQEFIDLVVEEAGYEDIGVLCFNPNLKMEVEGFNPLSEAPCFMINMAYHKDLEKARRALLKTNYYDKLPLTYKKYLNVHENTD